MSNISTDPLNEGSLPPVSKRVEEVFKKFFNYYGTSKATSFVRKETLAETIFHGNGFSQLTLVNMHLLNLAMENIHSKRISNEFESFYYVSEMLYQIYRTLDTHLDFTPIVEEGWDLYFNDRIKFHGETVYSMLEMISRTLYAHHVNDEFGEPIVQNSRNYSKRITLPEDVSNLEPCNVYKEFKETFAKYPVSLTALNNISNANKYFHSTLVDDIGDGKVLSLTEYISKYLEWSNYQGLNLETYGHYTSFKHNIEEKIRIHISELNHIIGPLAVSILNRIGHEVNLLNDSDFNALIPNQPTEGSVPLERALLHTIHAYLKPYDLVQYRDFAKLIKYIYEIGCDNFFYTIKIELK